MLRSLIEYYDKLDSEGLVGHFGWAKQTVGAYMDIDLSGTLTGVELASYETKNTKGKTVTVNPTEMLPIHDGRSAELKPYFLCDSAEYMFGIQTKDGKRDRSREQFCSMRNYVFQILAGNQEPEAKAILAFFDKWDIDCAKEHPAIQALEEIAKIPGFLIRINGKMAQEIDAISNAYDEVLKRYGIDRKDYPEYGNDMVTGERGILCRIHPKVYGFQFATQGGRLCSANTLGSPSLSVWGGEQGMNFPMTELNAFKYTSALSYIARNRAQNYYDKDNNTSIICWANNGTEKQEADLLQFIAGTGDMTGDEGEENRLYAFFKNICRKAAMTEYSDGDDSLFCIASLSSRDGYNLRLNYFEQGTLNQFAKGVIEHYRNSEMDGFEKHLTSWRIVYEVNKKTEVGKVILDKTGLREELNHAIFLGNRYPDAVIKKLVSRIRTDSKSGYGINPGRAALARAILIKNYEKEVSPMLDENCKDVGYLTGRVFAMAEHIQYKAMGKLQKPISQKYMAQAINYPATAMKAVELDVNIYLHKLRNSLRKPMVAAALEKKLLDITDMLPVTGYPGFFRESESSAFVVGYHQQREQIFRDGAEAKKEAAETTTTPRTVKTA